MKHLLTMVMTLVLVCGPAMAEDIKRLSLDDAASIGTTIATDSKIKVEGRSSVRISTRHPTTVCLGEVTALDVGNATLLYEANVRSDLDGAAFLEMWVQVGEGRYFSRGMNDPVKGKSEWRSIQTPFVLQKGQRADKVTLNLVINGKGTVWIDDIVLSQTPLK